MPREPAWHHRARKQRAAARTLVRASKGLALSEVQKARKLLDSHHGSSAGKMPAWRKHRPQRSWTRCDVCKTSKQWIWDDRIKDGICCRRCNTPWPEPEEEKPPDQKGNRRNAKAPKNDPADGDTLSAAELAALVRSKYPGAPPDATKWLDDAVKRENAAKAATPTKKPDAILVTALQTKATVESEMARHSKELKENRARGARLEKLYREKHEKFLELDKQIKKLQAEGLGCGTAATHPAPVVDIETLTQVPDVSGCTSPEAQAWQATAAQMQQTIRSAFADFEKFRAQATAWTKPATEHERPTVATPANKRNKGADGRPRDAEDGEGSDAEGDGGDDKMGAEVPEQQEMHGAADCSAAALPVPPDPVPQPTEEEAAHDAYIKTLQAEAARNVAAREAAGAAGGSQTEVRS